MLTMTQINTIRTLYYGQGKTVAEIVRETGKDRKTIEKYIFKESFNNVLPDQVAIAGPGRPNKLNKFTLTIDTWLQEDLKYKKKQRHTGKRVFNRLKEEFPDTFDCGYKTVSNYVTAMRKELYKGYNNCYVKLTHIPGEAQVDFGAAEFYETGKLYDGKYLAVSFPHSNQGYMQLFKGENQECLFEGLIAIFTYIGGVPARLWFDNTTTIVTSILKAGERILTDDFIRFKNHYMFESVFCNAGKGNEKGNVENKVGYLRRNLLVPVPSFESLEEYNSLLLDECQKDGNRNHYAKDENMQILYEDDVKSMIPLPKEPFNSCKFDRVKVDSYGRFTLNKGLHEYSAVPKLAGEHIAIILTANKVRVLDGNLKEVVIHDRVYGGIRQKSIKWLPFLNQLAAKPNAIKYSGIMETLPDPLKEYLGKSTNAEKSALLRTLAKIGEESSFEKAVAAAAEASKIGTFDPDSLRTIYTYQNVDGLNFADALVPKGIPPMEKLIPVVDAFDAYLNKRGDIRC